MTDFQWQCHPNSEKILLQLVNDCCKLNPFIAHFQDDLLKKTSTRLFDWIDHITIPYSEKIENQLVQDGFVFESTAAEYRVLHHPGAQFPRVVLRDDADAQLGLAISVDAISDFLLAHGLHRKIEGSPLSLYRRSCVSCDGGADFWVVERRGSSKMEPTYTNDQAIKEYHLATEMWQTRPRGLSDEDEAIKNTFVVAEEMIKLVGETLAAWIVLECERKYWQSRNLAGQMQKGRQDMLGMGWANHDHHTFRSSRRHFGALIRLFEMFGFICRERFYAGEEAGWGAQVMEHKDCRLVLFLDVDLQTHEIQIDYRHQQLVELPHLHTVGLWCGLHGDSILQAGMHHLEAQFMFDELKKDLEATGIGMMAPFSNFPFLRQAFTKGEMWPVDAKRVETLLSQEYITQEKAEHFMQHGAVGSHMENLQRREGYKGFNQQNVSTIIQRTDPRNINF